MIDYNPRRFDFLWVRWYDLENTLPQCKRAASKLGVCSYRLDQLVFPPLDEEDSIGFLDPEDVLCASHIIPAFAACQTMTQSYQSVPENTEIGMCITYPGNVK